ncbi:melanoma inhibitory activity protein 2 isoform X2 [Hyperolius riggenbachi]|uniref:melanoma inhibitory activity protein 2 isoform X2 n=1 Tax=Hyperolius riggenbachi TaxID=752182 RepID=UPI0035A2BAD4
MTGNTTDLSCTMIGRIAVLMVLLTAQLHGQKILSSKKRCGDPICESVMIRASAKQDYSGPDCRFLSFRTGEEINVNYKLTGEREDLWQGSTGKAYGFFPKDAVVIEQVYQREEVEVPAQEIDFVCLDGGEYVFENEDSVLHKSRDAEEEFLLSAEGKRREQRTLQGETSTKDSQDELPQEVTDKPTGTPPGIGGWFGIGRTEEVKSSSEPVIEDSLLEEQIPAPEANKHKEPKDAEPEKSGWFGGRIKNLLPFGRQKTQDETQATSSNSGPETGEAAVVEGDKEAISTQEPEQENAKTEQEEEPKPKWFNFAIKEVLGFGTKKELKNENLDQTGTETDDKEILKESSATHITTTGGGAEHDKTDISAVDQPTVGVTKEDKVLYPNIDSEDTAESNKPDKEEHTAACKSGEESSSGYCAVQQTPDHAWRNTPSPEEPCETVVKTPSISMILPSTEDLALVLKTVTVKCREIYEDYVDPVWPVLTGAAWEVVSLLPEDLQPGPDFHGCSWEVLAVTALVGVITVLAFTCRTVRCVKSRGYAGREKKLGEKFSEVLNSKSEVLEKLSAVQKQYEEVQQTLQQSGHQKLQEDVAEQKVLQESLQTSNKELEENVARLEKDLEEEKQRGAEMDSTLSELNEKIRALEENIKKDKSLKEEIRTTQKVFEINKGRLESSVQDAEEEQDRLQESIKQLVKEAEGWEERLSELSENSRMLNSSVQVMQEDMNNKQSQVKSLIDSLLKMKDWSSEVEDVNNEEEDDVLSTIKWDFENGEPLGDPQKQTIKKLIFAAMINASLKSVESEKKQLYENLSDEMKAKEQLSECITNLQNTNQSLALEKGQLEDEVDKLKQKMSVMMEVYQENERKLHRKLTVQERDRLQKEAKLSKADEKMILATSELGTVKTRLDELEEETEKTVNSYQGQVTSYEKKSHDNWLTARAAERYLSDVKRETLHLRQKLTEAEYKLELLEKDPFALDVIQAIGRDGSPYGLSPINRAPESRAFLSPPTLLEGPLRLSPMLPSGDRGMRPPGYYPGFPGAKERGDVNADRKSDHQRTLSDSGSLSPPWDREQKSNVPPPGLPYPEHHFPPRRPDRFYHYPVPSGRFSGPAELTRNQGRPFVEAPDGRTSPEYKSRAPMGRNGSENISNVPGAPIMEGETTDGPPQHGEYPAHPPPPMRVPLLPMEPRAPFFRRPFPMPPPMEMYGAPGYPGMPPHIAMRNPMAPPPRFSPYPMPNEPFYPPMHVRPPPPRDDHPPETQQVPPTPSDSTSDSLSQMQT